MDNWEKLHIPQNFDDKTFAERLKNSYAAWSNIRSVRNAVKSGLIPAWAEMTVKPIDTVRSMNI